MCWHAMRYSVIFLSSLYCQELLCGCICIEKAVDFYRFPGLDARLGHTVVPGSDSRPRHIEALCTLESMENNSDRPQKYSAGAVRGTGTPS